MNDKTPKKNAPHDISSKQDANEGSAGFNQGSAQDPDYDKGTNISDEEKLTGHTPSKGKAKEKGKDKDMGKNLNGGY